MTTRRMPLPSRRPQAQPPMPDSAFPIAIIGAGASGLMAAVAASRVRPHSVLLLEKEARVGRKLLATGNGRCNLLNTQMDASRYHGDTGATLSLLTDGTPAALLQAFSAMGLHCREEAEGRVYPYCGQANAVLDVLRLACARAGVQTQTDAQVTRLVQSAHGFTLTLATGETVRAQKVILSGGGKASPSFGADGNAYRLLTGLGHSLTPTFPAISPLRLPPHRVRGLKGVRTPIVLTLMDGETPVQQERGEALFTDYGISGVAAMQLARKTGELLAKGRKPQLSIQLLPPDVAENEGLQRTRLLAGEPMESFFTGLLHKQLGVCLLREADISPGKPISTESIAAILPLLSDWRLPVQGTQPFANAQVTAGGVPLLEFDQDTLESRKAPGLYACGEILNVDGDCGGYNLMWAWASGIAAGEAAARSLDA